MNCSHTVAFFLTISMLLLIGMPGLSADKEKNTTKPKGSPPLFSLKAKKMTMKKAFEKISADTGFDIELNEGGEEKISVDSDFKKIPLFKGLKKLLYKYDYVLLHEADRKLSVFILESSTGTPR